MLYEKQCIGTLMASRSPPAYSAKRPPLDGIRVLDFTRVIAGPLCTQHLADLGAEVIKVENPVTGDEVRGWDDQGTPGRSSFFSAFNRTKKSIALNLKNETGRQLAQDLARESDIVIENFRPGVMARFGLDQKKLRAINPRLIYVSISAYGASGSMSDRPGLDPVLQAESGMMSFTGTEDGPPLRHPLSIIDTLTAVQSLSAITSALFARERDGSGDFIDLCLYATAIGALNNAGLDYLTSGNLPKRSGNRHIQATPANLFQTKTEPIYIAAASDRLFQRLCTDVLEQPALSMDERFSTTLQRRKHRDELLSLIQNIMQKETADYWLKKLRPLPAGAVRTIDQALAAPETGEREMIWEVTDEEMTFRLLGSPFKFQNNTLASPKAPPHLGQDTQSVLKEILGLSQEKLNKLEDEDAVYFP